MSDPRLKAAFRVLDEDPDEAATIANDVCRDDPDNQAALFIIATVYSRAERYAIAQAVFERITRLNPKRHEAWSNLGMCLQANDESQKARDCFRRAYDIEPRAGYATNLATTYVTDSQFQEAMRWCRKALELEPQADNALSTLGFAQLATGDWAHGWDNYEYCLGGKFRREIKIGSEPRWDGMPVESLFIYGEQGLGDEIMYASMIPDAMAHAKQITVECDKRLEGLFQRSFPGVEVRGTRRGDQAWAAGRTFDAGCAGASLARFYRRDKSECPRTPYLVADPERRLQWRALFDSWGKPVIGIAWSGGRANTMRSRRNVTLDAFRPLIESRPDAIFVSLQYKDADQEIAATGLPVRHIPRAVQSPDYDDTAAFVAELDQIVGVHTTVHHLAGALGKPSTILVPEKTLWNYAIGDALPWYKAQVFHRQRRSESWKDCIRRLVAA